MQSLKSGELKLDQGLVHVIEDSHRVPRDFLTQLTLPLVFADAEQRNAFRESSPTEEYIARVKSTYEPHDWIHMLHQE